MILVCVPPLVEASLFPNWEGEVLTRYIKLSGDVLELSTDEVFYRNQMCKIYLKWVRIHT